MKKKLFNGLLKGVKSLRAIDIKSKDLEINAIFQCLLKLNIFPPKFLHDYIDWEIIYHR